MIQCTLNTRLIILILVPAKQNDVKLYIFKSDTKISEQKKFSKPLQKQACVLTVMYTRHSTLYMYISCAAVHVCPSEKKASAEAFERIL